MPNPRNEQETAWRLWYLLEELNSLLWERYESEFVDRHLAEEDQRWFIKSEAHESDQTPF